MNTRTKNIHQSKRRIPDFVNHQEAAQWWETHNVADFLDELRPVEMKFAKNFKSEYRSSWPNSSQSAKQPLRGLTLRLPASAIATLRKRASQRGIGSTTLARMMLIEKLHEDNLNNS